MTDGHVIVKQLSFHLDSWEASVCRILEHLGYVGSPAATRRKEDHQSVSSEILARFKHEGNNFLAHIMTEDEIWMHSFEPKKEA